MGLSNNAVRAAYPLATISAGRFIRSVVAQHEGIANPNHARAVLTCAPRPDVRTRFWWTLEWLGADNRMHRAEGESIDLLMWRAAEVQAESESEWGR